MQPTLHSRAGESFSCQNSLWPAIHDHQFNNRPAVHVLKCQLWLPCQGIKVCLIHLRAVWPYLQRKLCCVISIQKGDLAKEGCQVPQAQPDNDKGGTLDPQTSQHFQGCVQGVCVSVLRTSEVQG